MASNKIPELLIISQGSAFMVNSLETNIKKAGIYVTKCEPNVRDFNDRSEKADIVLLFAGDYIKEAGGVLSYISSKCSGGNKYFCIVGYPNEIYETEKLIDISSVSAEFTRPFDMKEFISKISALAFGKAAQDTAPASGSKPDGSEKHHLLLCDDDMMFLKMMQEWLSEKYRVTVVKTGLMAVPFSLKNPPELILLDYEMPGMNGPRVLEALRADSKTAQIPVVFLTGHSDRESVMEVMRLRPQGYLLKSTKQEDIIASVDNFFATGQWKNIQG